MSIMKGLRRKSSRRLMAALVAGGVCCGAVSASAAEKAEDIASYSLDEIIVTAERIPTKRMDTPANIAVITAEEIEANHYKDVAEALSHINGVAIERGGSHDLVQLNGDERVLIMVDGRRINTDQGLAMGNGTADLKSIPSLKNIERIEVVKGAGSALYGADAVGGIINIITKRGLDQRTTLDANFGSWRTFNYEIATEGSEGTFSWFVTGGLQKQGYVYYKMNGETQRAPHSDYDGNSFTARLDNTFDSSSSVRLNFEHRTNHTATYHNAVNHKRLTDYKRDEIFNNFAVSYHFKEDQETPGFLRYFNNYRGTHVADQYNTSMQGVDYQNGWTLGNNRLIVGAEWHQSKSSHPDIGYDDKELVNTAVYLQDTWNFADKWSLVPGLRMDHHNKFGTHWSPKVAVNYNANDKTQVYASWGRVFRAPTADDLFWKEDWGYGSGYFGHEDLKPETGWSATIGVNHVINKDMNVEFNLFKSELHDALTWYKDPNPLIYLYNAMNLDRVEKQGMELAFHHKISPMWSYDLGYSYTQVRSTKDGEAMGDYGGSKMPNGYRVGVHFNNGPWKANLYGTFGSGMNTAYYMTPNYTMIDFNLSFDATEQLTFYFKANNLTNQEYSEFRGPNSNYVGLGRFFQFGATFTF